MNLSDMPYKYSVIRTVILAACFVSWISLYAQDQSDWYNTRTKTYQILPTTDPKKIGSKLALRIVFGNYIITVSSYGNNQFEGHVIVHTSSIEEGDYKVRLSQKYFSDLVINPDTARMIYNLYALEGMARIPTDKDIAGWRYGKDGITYTIEALNNSEYSQKTYWTPSAFKNIEEAVRVNRFFSSVDSLLQLKIKWDVFFSELPKDKSYRYGSMIRVTVRGDLDKHVTRIIIKYRKADEPPVVGGRPEYNLIFNLDNSELVAATYSVGKDQISLEDTLRITPSLVKTAMEWARNKSKFSMDDLGLKRGQVGDSIAVIRYSLLLPIPTNLIVNIDSLSACKAYSMKQAVSTGGEYISVSIIDADHEEKFEFDNDNLSSEFDLKNYILCYALFSEILPEEFPVYEFFSEENLIHLINQYQKIVECEGYYYQEYVSKHPELNARDRRMMKGWDFKKYLQEEKGTR